MRTSQVLVVACFFGASFIAGISCNCIAKSFSEMDVTVCGKDCLKPQKVKGCVNPTTIRDDFTEVYISTYVRKFRRGAFMDLPHLKAISASNVGLEQILPGAFTNLPELVVVDFSSNLIEDVSVGVFNDLSLESLTLSSNNISYIDQEAFSNMPRLQTVLLSKNELEEFNNLWFVNSTSLMDLDLSYNKISKVEAWAFRFFPNLVHVDLSFNQIVEIGYEAFVNVKQLNYVDLTANNLTEVNLNLFRKRMTVKELRFAMNRVSFLQEGLFSEVDLQRISFHSNPWRCPSLKNAIRWSSKYGTKILEAKKDERVKYDNNQVVCFCANETHPSDCSL